MIYFVSGQQELFNSDSYKLISVNESLDLMKDWKVIQFDTETSGLNPIICDLLCAQFGNDNADARIVVDTSTVDILNYKSLLEGKYLIGHNLKFDLQFLYKHKIYPRKVYDTMIVEQMLYLGYPGKDKGGIGYGLKDVAWRRLNINIDKTVRGEIRWRGLDNKVIEYAAYDVVYLEKIMLSQWDDCKKKECTKGALLESYAVPSMAYLEWSGIHLDIDRWKDKMKKDQTNLQERKEKLNAYIQKIAEERHLVPRETQAEVGYSGTGTGGKVKVIKSLRDCIAVNLQGDLFSGFDTTPHCIVNWDAAQQVIVVCKELGFKTAVMDKATGEEKDTVLEKELSRQKGIDDTFLKLYFDYKEAAKVVSTYGQGHLDLINPVTGRLHTCFQQIGAATGRMSSGGGEDKDLTNYKRKHGYSLKGNIKFVNMQQLPHDAETRACFTSVPGYKFVSCDFSAEESRLGADVYNDEEMRKEFTERTGDTHAMFAWAVFRKECEDCGCTSALEVKAKAKPWRDKVKGVEFAYLFGAAAPTIAKSAGCSVEQAQKYIDDLNTFFAGRTAFCKKGSEFVRKNGYVLVNPVTGHKVYWWDHDKWVERQKSFTPEFWESYKIIKEKVARAKDEERPDFYYLTDKEKETKLMVTRHFQAVSKYDRYALNSPTQGTGAIIMKEALTMLFNYIVDNNLIDKVKLCVVVHDEINCEYSEELTDFPNVLSEIMTEAAAKYCKSLPIPACPEVGTCWIH